MHDLERVVSEAVKIKRNRNENLGFSEGAIWALEQLLLARHHMLKQVYSHRVRLITDAMIFRGTSLAADEDIDVKRLFVYDGSKTFLDSWMALDDETMMRAVLGSRSLKGRSLFSDLRARKLHKQVARIDLKGMGDALISDRLSRLEGQDRAEVENEIADCLGIDLLMAEPWRVIVNLVSATKPVFGGERVRMDPSTILIQRETNEILKFSDHPEVVRIFPEYREYLDVYLPGSVFPDRGPDRERFLLESVERIRALLNSKFS